tara:strand:- start:1389 stop:1565 length:177 start_codon:yes stop_codon:yes gene_type:complete
MMSIREYINHRIILKKYGTISLKKYITSRLKEIDTYNATMYTEVTIYLLILIYFIWIH